MRKKYIVMELPFQGYELIICIESRFSKKLVLELIFVPVLKHLSWRMHHIKHLVYILKELDSDDRGIS